MTELRAVDKRFVSLMEEKLETGRQKGYVGWDERWGENVVYDGDPLGPQGLLMRMLRSEVMELDAALANKNRRAIGREAADVANLAMFIADIHGGLD